MTNDHFANAARRLAEQTPTKLLDSDLAPLRTDGVASCHFRGSLVLATERGATPVALDGVSEVIWNSFNGTTTIGELAADVHAALGGDLHERTRLVSWITSSLALHGMVAGPGLEPAVTPRRVRPPLHENDCIAQTIGLRGATVLQIPAVGQDSFHAGSNLPDLVAALGPNLSPSDDEPRQLWFARGSKSPSQRARANFLLDGLGNRYHVAWSIDECSEAFTNTVAITAAGIEVCAVEGPAFLSPDGAVLIHPALREAAVDSMRSQGPTGAARLLPGALHQLINGSLCAPGRPAHSMPIAKIVMPEVSDDVTRFRHLLQVAWRWDDAHLNEFASLYERVQFVELPHSVSFDDIGRAITSTSV